MKLYVEPFRGLRAWRFEAVGERVLLHSLVMRAGEPWPVDGWFLAHDHSDPFTSHSHPAPAEGCICGVHALSPDRQEMLLRQYGFSIHVLGEVELAGRVAVHGIGFRAERARPSAIYVWDRPSLDVERRARVSETAHIAAETYGVPVMVLRGDVNIP